MENPSPFDHTLPEYHTLGESMELYAKKHIWLIFCNGCGLILAIFLMWPLSGMPDGADWIDGWNYYWIFHVMVIVFLGGYFNKSNSFWQQVKNTGIPEHLKAYRNKKKAVIAVIILISIEFIIWSYVIEYTVVEMTILGLMIAAIVIPYWWNIQAGQALEQWGYNLASSKLIQSELFEIQKGCSLIKLGAILAIIPPLGLTIQMTGLFKAARILKFRATEEKVN